MPQTTRRSPSALGAGLTLVAVVVLFSLGGLWLDGRAGTSPLFLLLGFFLGVIGGMIHLIHAVAPEQLPFHKTAPLDPPPEDREQRPQPDPDHPKRSEPSDPSP